MAVHKIAKHAPEVNRGIRAGSCDRDPLMNRGC